MKSINIYTDGACSGNPGPGGYACILIYNGKEKIISGSDISTTNNRMELLAVIEALKNLKEPCHVELYTDSAYIYNAFKENWLDNWQKNNWKNSQKKDVSNKDLWLMLLDLVNIHNVKFNKVKGHSDNINNNRCDQIAREEIIKLKTT